MDDDSDDILKKYCCTCLSQNRTLHQLCSIENGLNNFYFILSYDTEAFKEGFFRHPTTLCICWECEAHMKKLVRFRQQVCEAQKLLLTACERQDHPKLAVPLTCLISQIKTGYDESVVSNTTSLDDNFIDCNAVEVKTEDDDDVPLAVLQCKNERGTIANNEKTESQKPSLIVSQYDEFYENHDSHEQICNGKHKIKTKKAKINGVKAKKSRKKFEIKTMAENEIIQCREQRKLDTVYFNATFKCECCIVGFKTQIELEEHHVNFHSEKPNHTKCDICLCYIENTALSSHKDDHSLQYRCKNCDYVAFSLDDITRHWGTLHRVKKLKKLGSKPRQNQVMKDKRTPYGFPCPECNKYFDNKNRRWKHVQREHREGFRCDSCGKRFAFRSNLARHLRLHGSPLPRTECPVCHKMVRTDLTAAHARTHEARARLSCASCDRTFATRASYNSHLRYARPHVAEPVFKYKCSTCEKGYRSRGELRDHENYQHKGLTQHQCPICGKALATRRCIRRHVRRAHEGIKENTRDKICQQCGKAFRDKKGLYEHERTHTGERPLACDACGRAFRQSASLYAHKKRVHKTHAHRAPPTLITAATLES